MGGDWRGAQEWCLMADSIPTAPAPANVDLPKSIHESKCQASPFYAFRWLVVPLAITSFSIGPCWILLWRAILGNIFGNRSWTEELYVRSLEHGMLVCCYLVIVQIIVLSLLLTWSEGRLWVRLLVYWSCVVGLSSCVVGGLWFSTPLERWLEGRRSPADPYMHDTTISITDEWWGIAAIPLLLLAFQFPFWMIRGLLGWRLQRTPVATENTPGTTQRESLSIGDLLTGTAIVAVCLGLLRLGSSHERSGDGTSGREFLVELAISAVVIALALCATAVPLAALFLRDFRRATAWGAALLMAVFGTLVVYAAGWQSTTPALRWQALFNCGFGALTLILAYGGGLTLLRRSGWRLVWRKAGFGKPVV
jgi:hypothetical protein